MGRKKIEIKKISDKKSRKDTFHKRKVGLVKKAAELSMLCNVRMLLVFEDLAGEIIKYSTHGNYDPVQYFTEEYLTTPIAFTSKHYPDFFKNITVKKKIKDDDPDEEGGEDSEGDNDDDDSPKTETDTVTFSEPRSEKLSRRSSNSGKNSTKKSQGGRQKAPKANHTQQTKGPNHLFQQLHQHYHSAESSRKSPKKTGQQTQLGTNVKLMDLEVIEERDSFHADSSPTERRAESKFDTFKKEFNPRLQIDEEDENKKLTNFTNMLSSPNIFTASPIGFVGMSPIQPNLNNTVYEFQEAIIINGKALPTPGKVKKIFNPYASVGTSSGEQIFEEAGQQQQNQLQVPNRNINSLEVEAFLNENAEKGNIWPPFEDHFAGIDLNAKNSMRIIEEQLRENLSENYLTSPNLWSGKDFVPGGDHFFKQPVDTKKARSDKFFGFGILYESEGDLSKCEEIKNQKTDLDNSGMRLYSPFPIPLNRNTKNADWLQYYYLKQNDRTMQDEAPPSFLASARMSGNDDPSFLSSARGGDLSLSIAKSPKPNKKVKEN